jgi:hypothetical protein
VHSAQINEDTVKMRMRLVCSLALISCLVFGALFWETLATAAPQRQQSCQTYPQTDQTVCSRFLDYWNSHGGLAQQGYPISAEMPEVSELDNKLYTVQYFERAVFEYHPENQAPHDVLLSQLGTFRYKQKYSGTTDRLSPKSFQINDKAEMKPGVWISFFTADVSSDTITWRGVVHNDSGELFNLRMSREATTVVDSTGRIYPVSSISWRGEPDIASGGYRDIAIVAGLLTFRPIAPEAKYVALNIYSLSGLGPFLFYRNI